MDGQCWNFSEMQKHWNIYINLHGICLKLKILFVGVFFVFFLQNSFELSYKYDTVCHLSLFYCEMFTKFVDFFFLVSFFMFIAFTYHNLEFSAAAAGAYSTIYFNYFHIAQTYIYVLCTTSSSSSSSNKKIPHHKHLFAQLYTPTISTFSRTD